MTDTQSSPDSNRPAEASLTAAEANPQTMVPAPYPTVGRSRGRQIGLLYLLILILASLCAWQWWVFRNQIHDLRGEMAQRLRNGDTVNQETKVIVKTIQDAEKELRAKVSVLESKQTESQGQQLALEQMYQDLSKNRDDWALSEIEQTLSTASQQLQLAGNVQGALIALQNADKDLSRVDKPQFITIRRAIAKDMEALKSVPNLDTTGIALRLDSVISQVDSMPLLADEKPVEPPIPPKRALLHAPNAISPPKTDHSTLASVPKNNETVNGATSSTADWIAILDSKWQSFSTEMWSELKQLIRVRNVAHPEALMLSPTQAYYVRENLKIRLLNARLGLLSRNESAFRSDLIAAQDTITKYFDTRAKQTQTVQSLLRQVQNNNLSIQMPTLAESLNAVRNYKAKP